MSRSLVPLLLASLVLVLALALESAARPAADEPPLEFQLHVGGREIPVRLDQAFKVDVGDKQVEMRLTAASTRHFDNTKGVSFRYPTAMAFEYDDTEPGVRIWTLDGSACVFMLMRYDAAEVTPALAQAGMVEQMVEQFGPSNVNVSDARLDLGGTKHAAKRLDLTIAGETHRMEFVAFTAAGGTCLFVVQDQPTAGGPSAETQAALALLARTFRIAK